MYSFCLPFLDATIRNVCLDGHVLEELICPRTGDFVLHHHTLKTSTGRKAWDQVKNISLHISAIRIEQRQKASTNRPLVPHPPLSTISFRSFNQFVSSALTSSSIHSKVITSHPPPPLAISLTSSRTLELTLQKNSLISSHHRVNSELLLVGSPVSMGWR